MTALALFENQKITHQICPTRRANALVPKILSQPKKNLFFTKGAVDFFPLSQCFGLDLFISIHRFASSFDLNWSFLQLPSNDKEHRICKFEQNHLSRHQMKRFT